MEVRSQLHIYVRIAVLTSSHSPTTTKNSILITIHDFFVVVLFADAHFWKIISDSSFVLRLGPTHENKFDVGIERKPFERWNNYDL